MSAQAALPLNQLADLEAENAVLRKQASAVANANAVELMIEIEEARDELAQTTATLRHILDNVAHGFLQVGKNNRIGQEVSARCLELFSAPSIAGQPLAEVLRFNEQETDSLHLAMAQLFEDSMPEEVSLDYFDRRILIEGKRLGLSGKLIRDDESAAPDGLLLSVSDITIRAGDDGRGIDGDALLARAIAKGLVKQENAHQWSTEKKYELLLQDGLSTAESADEFRGRGVGFSAVAQELHQCGGSLHISTRLGAGTEFLFLVPADPDNPQPLVLPEPPYGEYWVPISLGFQGE